MIPINYTIATSAKKTSTIAWNILEKAEEVYTFATKMVVPPPLAFKASFEGVPVIWVKQFVVSEVLRYTGRLRKLYIGSWGFKGTFQGLYIFYTRSQGVAALVSESETRRLV